MKTRGYLLQFFNFYVAAKHVGVGIRRFTKKIVVVGFDGEQRGVYSREYARIAHAFVSSQIHAHKNPLRGTFFYHLFNVCNSFCWLNHTQSIPLFSLFIPIPQILAKRKRSICVFCGIR